MAYRPQWVLRPLKGYRYEPWIQIFRAGDGVQIPAPSAAGLVFGPNVISFELDADFLICGIAIDAGKNFRRLGFQFTDSYDRSLSDDFVGLNMSYNLLGQNPDRGGGYCVTFNPPHFAPAGSQWTFFVKDFDNVTDSKPDIELRGYKLYRKACP